MKGTLDASTPNAKRVLMEDKKEAAEHATIVDLIRNDLSRIATNVRVDRYRYIDILHTNKGDILQTSSEISGLLPTDYPQHLGDILDAQLPAGSITGAPKDKTLQIIHEAETYERGFYTGIMGIYAQGELNSAVMIRFLEENEHGLFFKAGGGITSKSDCKKEYEEVIQKMYLPIEMNKRNMEQQFVETIKLKDGKPQHLAYHQARMERTIRHFFPALADAAMPSLEKILLPTTETDVSNTEAKAYRNKKGIIKARIVYGAKGIENLEYAPYTMKEMHSLQVVEDNDIDYTYKSCDRSRLSQLASQKGTCDEVIIIKNGFVTDTSFTNLAIYDGRDWLTPRHPLLLGTKRAYLLDQGIIKEADITLNDLRKAQKVSLFNAMIEFGDREIDIKDVHF